MKKPYVGVSGVVSREQADKIFYQAEDLGLTARRRVLLGVKAVHKTQWLDIENKYGPDWYPVGRDISHIPDGPGYDGEFWVAQVFMDQQAAQQDGIDDYEQRFVGKLMQRTSGWLDGVQFDMLPWHETDYRPLFEEMKGRNPGLEILLQCQGPIMQRHSPQDVATLLDKYQDYVDHVLFDASHGTGREMDSTAMRPYLEEASQRDWLGVGVAGGLNAERVTRHIAPLLVDFPNLSFDAEGELHKNNVETKTKLNLRATKRYLAAAAEAAAKAGND